MKVQVLYTSDLSIFRISPNRPIDVARAAAMARDIDERKNMLAAYPIVVNENMEPIDGQHRLRAAQMAGVGIYYIVADGLTQEDQARAAELTKSWTTYDWTGFWASRRDQTNWREYQKLLDYAARYPAMPFGTALQYSRFGSDQNKTKYGFKTGGYVFTGGQHSVRLAEMYTDFRERGFPNGRELQALITSLYRNEDYDHAWMVSRMDEYPNQIGKCQNTDDYLLMLQGIYNYNRLKKNRVYLLAA